MSAVLFLPLNTNHVAIFRGIAGHLRADFEFLCHDRVSEAGQYHTASVLKRLGLPFRHLHGEIRRNAGDSFFPKVWKFTRMKRLIRQALQDAKPRILVLAMDNDPIAQVAINEAKRLKACTVLVQEALIRPHEYNVTQRYMSDYLFRFLSSKGIYLNYTLYGDGQWDRMLLTGHIAAKVMKARGIPDARIAIVGSPKYDDFMKTIGSVAFPNNLRKTYLFAASTKDVKKEKNVSFLKRLVKVSRSLDLHLIVKLHPRGEEEPHQLYQVLGCEKSEHLEVIKQGDETLEILKRCDALVTVASTMILEALMMGREGILASYLAGRERLEYEPYDAVFSIEAEESLFDVIKESTLRKKSPENKRRLLKDELFSLDGQAGQRAADILDEMVQLNHY